MLTGMLDNTHQNVQSIFHGFKLVLLLTKHFFQQLVRHKKIESVYMEYDDRSKLRKSLTLSHLIGIGLGGTIGTGIFVLSGQAAAKYAGPSIIISFVLAGIVALLSTLSMAEMAAMMSSAGSVYTYTYVALGEYPAFLIGWLSTLLYQLGASVVVVRWSHFVVHFIDLVSDYNTTNLLVQAPVAWSEDSEMFYATGQAINLPAIAITFAITLILIKGVRETAIINLVFVVFKIIVLLIFIFACCTHVDRKNYEPFFPSNQGSHYGVTGMLQASTYVFFAFVGFETVTTAAQEAKKPARYIAPALILSLLISLLLYVGVCTVMVGLVPYAVLNTSYPLAEATKATPYGVWLPIVLDLGAIASLTTVAITLFFAQSRILYSMSHDGLLPMIFARVHGRTKTPWVSIVVTGVICGILSGICPVDILGEITSVAALITYLFVHICVIVMYFTHSDKQRPFQIRFGKWIIPVLGSLLCILLLYNTTKGTAIRFGIWMVICHIVYFSYSFRFSRLRSENNKNPPAAFYSELVYVIEVPVEIPPKLESNDEFLITRL